MNRRSLAFTLAGVWVPWAALASLPKNNAPGAFWEDQWTPAMRWWVLPPHVWSILFAVAAVVGTAWFVRRALSSPPSGPPADPVDLDPATHRKWKRRLIGALVLFYAPAVFGSFSIYDDPQNIWLNDTVTGFTWDNFVEIVFRNHKGVNQEWMFLSLFLNHAVSGRAYIGYILVNLAMLPILLHLVHAFAWGLMKNRKIALLSVAFFGLSPILAELVCWMLERGHYFGLMWALFSAVSYLRWLDVRNEPGWRKWRFYALSLFGYASCQFGKPIFLYVPLWLILFDLWVGRRGEWLRAALEKIPFFVLLGIFLRKIVLAGDAHNRVRTEFIGGSLSNTLALDVNHVLEYLRSAFFPYQTGLRTPWNEPANWLHVTGIPNIFVHGFSPLASAILLACLLIVAIVLSRRYGWSILLLTGVGSVVSVGTVMNLPVHTVVHAYRYTLSMNVLTSVCLAAATFHAMAPNGPLAGRPDWVRRGVPVVLATIWLTLGAYHTNANRQAWRDPQYLWTRSANVLYPWDGWSHYYAGKTLQWDKQWWRCIAHEQAARKYLPSNEMSLRRLGDCWYGLGEHEMAARYWEPYFRRYPGKITEAYERKLRTVGLDEVADRRRR